MTSTQIRQSFLDFFREKEHTIVPSSSLLPDSPNLLFTNAGMNQFVPIFLGQMPCPYQPGRAADTQKCIRAGGKHNDLDDVGLDTYHHTFFEMLGNWSFGDYFKKEAIAWAWELIVERWRFPAARLYATVYSPDKTQGDPSDFDQEAHDFWAEKFASAGLDPAVHIVRGNRKDNFWMMGDTGPCGPCSELHVDLTPEPRSRDMEKRGASLVNAGDPRCIEIWNLVFIQFNAQPVAAESGGARIDFVPLAARHVDTGMGFERVTSIIQGTKNFADFTHAKISNYETDIFRPIFDLLEKLSGKKYGSTLPAPGSGGETEQERIDVAFRVIADHIRTLSFAVADGILPGNTDRHYVLRRILRRAVRYGRTLGFRVPFFFKLVDVLGETMGDVFPEIRTRRESVSSVLRAEEEAFNKTLDRGIGLFEAEVTRLMKSGGRGESETGSAGILPVSAGILPASSNVRYWKRRLPHYERPHGIYHVTFRTRPGRVLSAEARTIVLNALKHFHGSRYGLFAACVMPDHVHALLQPLVKDTPIEEAPSLWSLREICHSWKSYTAKEINEHESRPGTPVWQEEYHDRLMRSDKDLEEKFIYICRNPWDAEIVGADEEYEWLWTQGADDKSILDTAGQDARQNGQDARAPQSRALPEITGEFAFTLYDTYGFPLDLTQLMARERGLTVDVAGFEHLMEQQRTRARAAQKKQIIELSQLDTTKPTEFVGYDTLRADATVREIVAIKDKLALITDRSPAYAEMGGQVGDTGEIASGDERKWKVANTQKSGNVWLHLIAPGNEEAQLPVADSPVTIHVDVPRRRAIERHHSVTHLLHWALHEVVSRDATQKGSFVGPDKLTFDFNSAALTPSQVRDVERLVNERIVENAPISWTEVPFSEVKARPEIMQFFGDKYGERVRVVQIGGTARQLDGYSMELCAGTHTRATGEIGLFRIVGESAIAAGVRRIEAAAGLNAYDLAHADSERLKQLAARVGAPLPEFDKRIDALLTQQKELEKQLESFRRKQAAHVATALMEKIKTLNAAPAILEPVPGATGDELQSIADALNGQFKGVVVLAGATPGHVALVATVSPEFVEKLSAGKIIQTIAPLVGGKGGGRAEAARGAGKDPTKIGEALDRVKALLVG
jgi:alanyl-tRNA synthetase/REP element-mobilizing transposase RayT